MSDHDPGGWGPPDDTFWEQWLDARMIAFVGLGLIVSGMLIFGGCR